MSLHRLRNRKKWNKKAFSSIVGAIFMILIVGSLASAYFFFTLSQNNLYNDAVRANNQLAVNRITESVQVLDTKYNVNTNGVVTISAKIQNTGSSSVDLVTLWVTASEISGALDNYNYIKTNFVVQAGQLSSQSSFDVPVQGITNSKNYTFAAWFITSLGNTVPLQSGQSNTITFAEVAAGIGSIAMNQNAFRSYVATGGVLSTPNPSYTVSHSVPLAFSISVINLDKSGRDLDLNYRSSFWVLNPPDSQGAVKGMAWPIAKVSGNSIMPLPSNQTIHLPYGIQTTVYFYNQNNIGNQLSTTSAAVNLLLVGTLETNPVTDYGQNLPFIAITIS